MAYTVDVKNVFSLLDDDKEEPQLTPTEVEPKPKKKNTSQTNSVKLEQADQDEDFLPVGKRNVRTDTRRGRAEQGLGKGRRGRVRVNESSSPQVDAGLVSGDGGYSYGPSPQQHDENRLFSNGRGRGRGGRRTEFDVRGKREFDRSDGTGRGHETEKRAGSGRGNWGRQGDEYEQVVTEGETEDERVEGTQIAGEQIQMNGSIDESVKVEAEEKEQPKEEKVMTLEEYEQTKNEQKQQKKKKVAAEQDVKSQFKGMQVMKKTEVDMNEDMGLTKVKEVGRSKSGEGLKARKEKELASDLACFTFGDEGSRRGCNDARKRRSEAAPKYQTAPQIDNTSFPQLGQV